MSVPARAWLLVALLWVVALLNYLDRQVIFSVLPPLQAELHLSNLQLGLLGTMFLLVYGILSPFAGFVSDRFGRRAIIFLSLLVWSVVTWATGHARNGTELMLTRALMGISEACYLPAAMALLTEYHSERTRSRAVGLHWTGNYFGLTLGGFAGGWIGQTYGWRAVFFILGAIGVGYSLVLGLALRRFPAPPAAPRSQERIGLGTALARLVRVPDFVRHGTTNAVASIGWWIVYTWLPLHLYERFHMSLAEAGFTATFYLQGASFAGVVAGGWIADRWSRTNIRGRLFPQILGLSLAGPLLFVIGYTHSVEVLIPILLLTGFGRGMYECNLMPVMCQFTPPELRATGFGLYNAASCLLSGTMIAVAGALKSTLGLGGALEMSACIMMACALYLTRIQIQPTPRAVAAGLAAAPGR
jgi:MFS family permease